MATATAHIIIRIFSVIITLQNCFFKSRLQNTAYSDAYIIARVSIKNRLRFIFEGLGFVRRLRFCFLQTKKAIYNGTFFYAQFPDKNIITKYKTIITERTTAVGNSIILNAAQNVDIFSFVVEELFFIALLVILLITVGLTPDISVIVELSS